LTFIFNLKFILNLNFSKWRPSVCALSLGFPQGGGFPADQLHPRGALREQNTAVAKNRFPEVLCVFQIPPEQTPVSSPGNSLLCGNQNTDRATLSGTPSSKEQQNSTGATSPPLLRSLTTTLEQIGLWEILLLEKIQG
jgi:hypothetical protein